MASWITNGLKSLRVRVGGAVGSVPQQRSPPHYGAEIVKGIKIPPRPKRPLSAYFRFLGEVRPEVVKQNPHAKATELVKIMASRWESLDATSKQPYLTAFRNEMVTFSSRLDKYNKSLNQDQREVIDQLKLERQLQKEKKEKRKRLKELGKPKKPATPYFLFVTNKVPKGSGITEYQAAAKDLAAEWKGMTDDQKAPYLEKYKKDHTTYEKSLLKWEDQMRKLGNEDLIPEKRRQSATAK